MDILFCAAEAAPFVKVGGLGDVVGSLPKALTSLGGNGLRPALVLPRYGCIDSTALTPLDASLEVSLLGKRHTVKVSTTHLPGTQIPVYFIENELYFASRQEVYPVGDPSLEAEGFLLFSKAILALVKHLKLEAPILHLHDWHTTAVAVDLAELRRTDPAFAGARSVLTVHNLAYQGFYAGVNWLQEGLRHADAITAVSPTYAQEIQTEAYGCGLETLLQERAPSLTGILNGLDTALFNPGTDPLIVENYDAETFASGKGICKHVLQKEVGLPVEPDVPLIGMVTRLVEQKGLGLLLSVMDLLAKRRVQWVILGAGDPAYEALLQEYNARHPNIRTCIGYNAALAQQIYSGADIFLMPSRFEPCGLGQMIALRYGAVPVVRATGGLVDTVADYRQNPDWGTGFLFNDYSESALVGALDTALSYYKDEATWRRIVRNGMLEDFGWEKSAKAYRHLYQNLKAFS